MIQQLWSRFHVHAFKCRVLLAARFPQYFLFSCAELRYVRRSCFLLQRCCSICIVLDCTGTSVVDVNNFDAAVIEVAHFRESGICVNLYK